MRAACKEQYQLLGARGHGLVVGKPWEEQGVYSLEFIDGKLTIRHKWSKSKVSLAQTFPPKAVFAITSNYSKYMAKVVRKDAVFEKDDLVLGPKPQYLQA
eukprot:4912824-Amphidinium_carterae.1